MGGEWAGSDQGSGEDCRLQERTMGMMKCRGLGKNLKRPGRTREDQGGPGRSMQGRARDGQGRPRRAREGQGESGRVREGQGGPRRAREGQGGSGRVRKGQGESGRVREGQGGPGGGGGQGPLTYPMAIVSSCKLFSTSHYF